MVTSSACLTSRRAWGTCLPGAPRRSPALSAPENPSPTLLGLLQLPPLLAGAPPCRQPCSARRASGHCPRLLRPPPPSPPAHPPTYVPSLPLRESRGPARRCARAAAPRRASCAWQAWARQRRLPRCVGICVCVCVCVCVFVWWWWWWGVQECAGGRAFSGMAAGATAGPGAGSARGHPFCTIGALARCRPLAPRACTGSRRPCGGPCVGGGWALAPGARACVGRGAAAPPGHATTKHCAMS